MDKHRLKPIQVGSRPIVPGIPNPTCPILLEAKSVLDKSQDLHRAIRKLRRSTQRCHTCPEFAGCHVLRSHAHALESSLHDLMQEWGL